MSTPKVEYLFLKRVLFVNFDEKTFIEELSEKMKSIYCELDKNFIQTNPPLCYRLKLNKIVDFIDLHLYLHPNIHNEKVICLKGNDTNKENIKAALDILEIGYTPDYFNNFWFKDSDKTKDVVELLNDRTIVLKRSLNEISPFLFN